MTTIETIIKNRRIEIAAPDNLPDGTKVSVGVIPLSESKIGLDESEWRDDAQALAEWDAWLTTIEPIDWREPGEFEQEFRRVNIEAVRKQMAQ